MTENIDEILKRIKPYCPPKFKKKTSIEKWEDNPGVYNPLFDDDITRYE